MGAGQLSSSQDATRASILMETTCQPTRVPTSRDGRTRMQAPAVQALVLSHLGDAVEQVRKRICCPPS